MQGIICGPEKEKLENLVQRIEEVATVFQKENVSDHQPIGYTISRVHYSLDKIHYHSKSEPSRIEVPRPYSGHKHKLHCLRHAETGYVEKFIVNLEENKKLQKGCCFSPSYISLGDKGV